VNKEKNEDPSDKAIQGLIAFIIGVTIVPIWYGWVISILWGIYAVPLGGPQLGVVQAYGLHMVVGRLIIPTGIDQIFFEAKMKHGILVATIAHDMMRPGFYLVIGWALAKVWGLA
jgi:hypothetical protein